MPATKSKKKQNLLDQFLVFGSSLVYLGRDSADELVKTLEENELLVTPEGKEMADDIQKDFKKRKKEVQKTVRKMLKSIVDEMGIATKEDLKKLQQQ
jgi:polyhydroxyalkanoate synthesis regulator phasin